MRAAVLALGCCVVAPATAAVASAAVEHGDSPVLVGAIRWDGYWGKPGERKFDDYNFGIVARTTTYDMSVSTWHYRVPFFGDEINETAITADGDSPEVMGQELE
jgi:hypothetical protein